MPPFRLHGERDESLNRLVRLVATEKNMHRLVSRVASDVSLLKAVRRELLYEARHGSVQKRLSALRATYEVQPEVFEKRLKTVAYVLNLVERDQECYKTLGLDRDATPDSIKSAFRQLSLVNHPDTNPGNPEAVRRFQDILRAYQILSNDELRRHYDHPSAIHTWAEELVDEKRGDRTALRRRLGRTWQLGVLIVLLVVLCFLVDYQHWLTIRYYHLGKTRLPETTVAAEPERTVRLPQDPTQHLDLFKKATDDHQLADNHDETLTQLERFGSSLSETLFQEPAEHDSAQSLEPLTSGDIGPRIADFLKRYAEAYEHKDLVAFLSLFEPNATENGKPLSSLVPLYLDNFHGAHRSRFDIDLQKWILTREGVDVDGLMHIAIQFRDELPLQVNGVIRLQLVGYKNNFRIKRLDYSLGESDWSSKGSIH